MYKVPQATLKQVKNLCYLGPTDGLGHKTDSTVMVAVFHGVNMKEPGLQFG